ncbi:MarR family transcriptional regulator [Aeromonas allosaccharophila]|uniref:MarR family transcriptional regulator n=1 Tax=Aeromonas allosaccharophila TaxID=656 RepID=UPI0005A92212|nr:MarR family transcriptional regulator [Aeromonas allosaccharophila]
MLVQKKKPGPRGVSREQAMLFLQLNKQGWTMKSIGETHNLHTSNVSRAIKKLQGGGYDAYKEN